MAPMLNNVNIVARGYKDESIFTAGGNTYSVSFAIDQMGPIVHVARWVMNRNK